MKVLDAIGINDAMYQGFSYLVEVGVLEPSRNGPVLVAPGPVTTVYSDPLGRVSLSATRNANPFFHLMEALWMFSGQNDIQWPVKFNKRYTEYSDDGISQWGAYGWRWRRFFGYDQLESIIAELRTNPTSRRCVLSMWNAMAAEDFLNDDPADGSDLYRATNGGKDVPCNTHTYFDCRGGVLNMTVCNRSNDALWGAYGANIVHFSMLQEYIAARIGVPVGVYRQVSNNFHVYTDICNKQKLSIIAHESNLLAAQFERQSVCSTWHVPLLVTDTFDADVLKMMRGEPATPGSFVALVAEPMYRAWMCFKAKGFSKEDIVEILQEMPACDWKLASTNWINRVCKRREERVF